MLIDFDFIYHISDMLTLDNTFAQAN